MALYPVFFELKDRNCLVVGGGRVATRKTTSLLECGARVRVVAPRVVPDMERLALAGKIGLERREYRREDLDGMFLVIAATDDPAVNRRVSADARSLGVPVNVVDSLDASDFIVPSVVRRGDLVIAISTSGHSPALARWLREELESRYGEEYARLLELVGRIRRQTIAEGEHFPYELWRDSLGNELVELLRAGREEEAERKLLSALRGKKCSL